MALSHPFKEDVLHRFLSPAGDRCCGVLGFACARRPCLKYLNTSDLPRRKPWHSDCRFGPVSSFQGRLPTSLHLSTLEEIQPIDGVMSLALLVPAGSVSSSSTLQIFRDASHCIVTVVSPASLSAQSFPSTPVSSSAELTYKGVNECSKYVKQIQQQRRQSPTVTPTWHACNYKVHNLHQWYILNCCTCSRYFER